MGLRLDVSSGFYTLGPLDEHPCTMSQMEKRLAAYTTAAGVALALGDGADAQVIYTEHGGQFATRNRG